MSFKNKYTTINKSYTQLSKLDNADSIKNDLPSNTIDEVWIFVEAQNKGSLEQANLGQYKLAWYDDADFGPCMAIICMDCSLEADLYTYDLRQSLYELQVKDSIITPTPEQVCFVLDSLGYVDRSIFLEGDQKDYDYAPAM